MRRARVIAACIQTSPATRGVHTRRRRSLRERPEGRGGFFCVCVCVCVDEGTMEAACAAVGCTRPLSHGTTAARSRRTQKVSFPHTTRARLLFFFLLSFWPPRYTPHALGSSKNHSKQKYVFIRNKHASVICRDRNCYWLMCSRARYTLVTKNKKKKKTIGYHHVVVFQRLLVYHHRHIRVF